MEAAPNKVLLSADATPGYTHNEGLTEESARKASELLQLNHDLHHTRFNGGFHNHITHHVLALLALGASPDEMQAMWEYNKTYQAALEAHDADASTKNLDFRDPEIYTKSLGKDECYPNFLRFFEGEIAKKGVLDVVREYVLKRDDRANDLHGRMYTDLVHPMIHLGCALEFHQPSLVAEALAAAAVHDNWPMDFLLPSEERARAHPMASKPLLEIIGRLPQDPNIISAVQDSDPFNKIRDGLLKRVTGKQLAVHLSQYQVRPTDEDLRSKLAEMMYTCAYMLGAAQRPGKREAIDFVLLHSVTLSVFYPAILSLDWISNVEKAYLLEAKARVDLVLYAGCGSPELYPERIVNYKPRRPRDSWPELIRRSIVYYDEGHVAKLIRALYCVEQMSEPVPEGFPIAKKDFVKIAHMAVDSVERVLEADGHKMPDNVAEAMAKGVGQGGEMVVGNMKRWVFYGGLKKTWDFVPDL